MTDEALCALEREVEAGGTPAQRLRLAHALERAGRAGEVARALAPARSAPEVRRALLARPSWESEAGPGDTGALDVAPVLEPRVLWTWRPKRKDGPGGLLATGFTVLARSDDGGDLAGGSVVGLDSETGEERWRPGVRLRVPAVAVGDAIVVEHQGALRGHDAWTGARRWEVAASGDGVLGSVHALARSGAASVVAATSGEVRSLVVDGPGPPVASWTWRTRVDRERGEYVQAVVCGGGLVAIWRLLCPLTGHGPEVYGSLVLDADTGTPRFELEGRVLALDAQGGVIRLVTGGLATFGLDGVVRSPLDGYPVLLAMTSTSLILGTREGVVRTDRSAQLGSALLLPPGGTMETGHGPLPTTGALATEAALYVVGLEPTGDHRWTLRALAPDDGRELWRHVVASPGDRLPRLAAVSGRLYIMSDRGAVQALGT